MFEKSTSRLISHGITYLTQKHAIVLCALVQSIHDTVNGAAATLEDDFLLQKQRAQQSDWKQKKALLENNLYFLRTTHIGEGERSVGGIPCGLLEAIVIGLRNHAIADRNRLIQLKGLASTKEAFVVLRRAMDSFYSCVGALVDIGEIMLRRLPSNPRTRILGGLLVRALTEAFLEPEFHSLNLNVSVGYLKNSHQGLGDTSLISPTRYADSIMFATKHHVQSQQLERGRTRRTDGEELSMKQILEKVNSLLLGRPEHDVQDVVRSLFVLDLVDIRVSGCGYGDFLVWCGIPVHALDPAVFHHYENYPVREGDEMEEAAPGWTVDDVSS